MLGTLCPSWVLRKFNVKSCYMCLFVVAELTRIPTTWCDGSFSRQWSDVAQLFLLLLTLLGRSWCACVPLSFFCPRSFNKGSNSTIQLSIESVPRPNPARCNDEAQPLHHRRVYERGTIVSHHSSMNVPKFKAASTGLWSANSCGLSLERSIPKMMSFGTYIDSDMASHSSEKWESRLIDCRYTQYN